MLFFLFFLVFHLFNRFALSSTNEKLNFSISKTFCAMKAFIQRNKKEISVFIFFFFSIPFCKWIPSKHYHIDLNRKFVLMFLFWLLFASPSLSVIVVFIRLDPLRHFKLKCIRSFYVFVDFKSIHFQCK